MDLANTLAQDAFEGEANAIFQDDASPASAGSGSPIPTSSVKKLGLAVKVAGGAAEVLAKPMVQTMLATLPEELRVLGPVANGLLQVAPMVPAFRAMTTVIKMIQVGKTLQKAETLIMRYSSSWWISKFLSSTQFSQEVYEVTASLALHLASLAACAVVGASPSATRDESPTEKLLSVEEFVKVLVERDPESRERQDLRQRIRGLQKKRTAAIPAATIQAKARAGDFDAVEDMLLQDASLITATGGSFNLLHQAIFWENMWAAAMLINFGVDLNAKTLSTSDELPDIPAGSTALHIATTIGNPELVRLLLCREADVNIRDSRGKTPLDLSEECQFAAIKDDLQTAAEFAQIRKSLHRMALNGSSSTSHADFTDLATTLAFMMDHKIPLNTRLGEDFSLIHYAAMYGNDTVYRLAVASGASPLLRSKRLHRLPSEIVAWECRIKDQAKKQAVIELMRNRERAARPAEMPSAGSAPVGSTPAGSAPAERAV